MTRPLVLAYHFPPIGGGGVQRNTKFVRYLPEFGHSPLVVTGPGGANDRWTPGDESLLDEIPPDTPIYRVPGPEPEVSTGLRGTLERRLMLPTPFTGWWTRGAVATGRSIGRDATLVYASLVPYETGEGATELARALGVPWIADLQDPWALDEMWLYPSALHRRVDLRRMRRRLRSAAAIVMNTPEALRRVRYAFPELANRPLVAIPNGYDAADFACPSPERQRRVFRIVHTGYLHTDTGQRLRRVRFARRLLGGTAAPVDILPRSHIFLLQALERLLETDPLMGKRIEVVLAGVTSSLDRALAEQSPVAVTLPGYLPHAETIALVRGADLLFLPMHDLPPGYRAGLVPGKAYEYLASGRPILAAVPDGDARDLLTAAGTAFLCRPTDVAEMTRIVRERFERWEAGEPYPQVHAKVLRPYERRELTRRLAALFDEVSKPAGTATIA